MIQRAGEFMPFYYEEWKITTVNKKRPSKRIASYLQNILIISLRLPVPVYLTQYVRFRHLRE